MGIPPTNSVANLLRRHQLLQDGCPLTHTRERCEVYDHMSDNYHGPIIPDATLKDSYFSKWRNLLHTKPWARIKLHNSVLFLLCYTCVVVCVLLSPYFYLEWVGNPVVRTEVPWVRERMYSRCDITSHNRVMNSSVHTVKWSIKWCLPVIYPDVVHMYKYPRLSLFCWSRGQHHRVVWT